ncbi:MAG: hypothetical protein KatS3mg101_0493 [Patescibacteria group bacterium]|nr:MAG: hypothetical protein KatS3mg101_0493 [Patescibacteria group bacterium]
MKLSNVRIGLIALLIVVVFTSVCFVKVSAFETEIADLKLSNEALKAQLQYSMSLVGQCRADELQYKNKINSLSMVVLDLATQLLAGDAPAVPK